MVIHKVALVTGSNKGLGFAIVEELLNRGVDIVYVTARDEQRGQESVRALQAKGLNPIFHKLDVTDPESVRQGAEHIKLKHDGLDILVNNAGVSVKNINEITYEDSIRIMNTNYYGVQTVEKHFFPILNQGARVINISSNCGHISNLKNKYWIDRLRKEDLDTCDVDAFVYWFLDTVKTGKLKSEDFYQLQFLAYRISKIAITALTDVQQREIDRNISVNSIHPGHVQTAMTRGTGFMTPEEASKAPVALALDVEQSVKGQHFWPHRKNVLEAKDWSNPELPLYCDFEELKCSHDYL